MVVFSEVFLSELLGVRVVDRTEKTLGTIRDVLATFQEPFPKIVGFYLHRADGHKKGMVLLSDIDVVGRQIVVTRNPADRIAFVDPRNEEIRLAKHILDRQIVDVNGARVVRVNDLKIALVGQDVRVIAADVGFTGLLRRLGLLGIVRGLAGLFRIRIREVLIGWNYVEPVESDFARGVIAIPHARIGELHPSDVAHIISQLRTETRQEIFATLPDKTAAEALHELEPKIQAYLLTKIDSRKALAILDRMPVDEAADVLGDIPPDKSDELLRLMKPRKGAAVRKLLTHRDESAGGLMTTECITLPQTLTCEQAIARLREIGPDAETIYYVYIVDDAEKLVGVISLRSLIISPPETSLSQIMKTNFIHVSSTMNQREVADMISKYNLLAVPVLDESNRILGIITVDDVMDYILPPISRRKRDMLG